MKNPSDTAAVAVPKPQEVNTANTNVLQTHLAQNLIREANAMDTMAMQARKEGNHALADELQRTALEKLREGHKLQKGHQAVSANPENAQPQANSAKETDLSFGGYDGSSAASRRIVRELRELERAEQQARRSGNSALASDIKRLVSDVQNICGKAQASRADGNIKAADNYDRAAERMLNDGRARLHSRYPSFTGGLGVSNAKSMLAHQKLNDARYKRSRASELESMARRPENANRASSLRSEASRLRSEASWLEQEGNRMLAELKKK